MRSYNNTFQLLDGLEDFLNTFGAMQTHLQFHHLRAIEITIRIASETGKNRGSIIFRSFDGGRYLRYPF